MRTFAQLLVLCAAAFTLAACSIEAVTFTQGDDQLAEDCAAAGDEDGNGLADCDDPACAGAPSCQPVCGNGKAESGEGCDDGNGMDGDGCDNNCTVTGCGNGIQSSSEACDDGNTTSGDGCDNNCTITGCGNNVMTTGEACDDGNLTSGDGCDANCTATACGNGIKTTGEACDDGNLTSGDGCDANCTATACGNGIKTTGEACDDGNLTSGDGCDANCTATACGNGVVTSGEQCDDGNTSNNDVCLNTCRLAICGDGFVYVGVEQCDDGNVVNGDGCEANCTLTSHSVPANPVLWLQFDDPPDDGVLDSGTGGHVATCTSCPALVPGVFGRAYAFTAGNRVDVAAKPDLGPGTAFTVAAWVRVDVTPAGNTVIGCKNVNTSDCTYALLMGASNVPTYHSAGGTQTTASSSVAVGTWHHMAMTWNGTTRVGYLDGVAATTINATMVNDAMTVLSIGARNYATSQLTFIGAIDDFMLYNRVLSAAELAQLAKQ